MADERCCFHSRFTGAQCLLQEGHPCYQATRFHRYPTEEERGREEVRRKAAWEFNLHPSDATFADYGATGCTLKSWCVRMDDHALDECLPFIAAGDVYLKPATRAPREEPSDP